MRASYGLLLDGDVSEVDEHVVHLVCATVILGAAEAAKATLEQIRSDRPERRHQDVQPQIKLLT